MSDSIDEIQGIFFEECAEGLAAAEAGLAAMMEGQASSETIASVFRAVHSIKGGSGAFGHNDLLKFSHLFENVLDDVRSGKIEPTQSVVKTLLISLDMLSDHVAAAQHGHDVPDDQETMAMLEAVQAGETPLDTKAARGENAHMVNNEPKAAHETAADADPFGFQPVQVSLDALDQSANAEKDPFGFEPVAVVLEDFETTSAVTSQTEAASSPIANEKPVWRVRFEPSRAAMSNGGEPVLVIREMERLGGRVEKVDFSRLPELRAMDPEAAYFCWELSLPATVTREEIDECFDFVAPDSVITVTEPTAATTSPQAVTVDDTQASEQTKTSDNAAGNSAIGFGSSEAKPASPVKPATAEPAAALPSTAAIVANASAANASASAFAGSAVPASVTGEPKANDNVSQTIRVDLNRLDNLLNLVGELVIRNSILSDRLTAADQERVQLSDLTWLTREIQDNVMSLRAQPIRQVFSRVPRLLRELSMATGKTVRLETIGEHTEVDKGVIERMGDPLTHMIRNAVDHGLETPEERIAAGKPVEGLVRISAEQKGGRILVRVSDDGRGINRAKVRQKAVERGIIGADSVLSDEDCDSLIMAPGFSTADTISNISGRGVGMDVVRSNVEAMGGRVEIVSVPGKGTTFTMALPLTLAILDGMIVRLGDQRFVLPLSNVVEAVVPSSGQVRHVTPEAEVIDLRGSYLPVRRLSALFELDEGHVAPLRAPVIIVDTDVAGHVGLMVDAIDDRREVVIKSLDANFYPIRGVAGATILGDGSIALILDIDALVASGAAGHGIRLHGKGMAA